MVTVLPGCTGNLSALDPAGPAARSMAQIWNIMAWGSAAILVFMVLLAIYACVRRPKPDEPVYTGRFIVAGGIVFPGLVLFSLLVYGLRTGDAQAPQRDEDGAYRIEVTGHQWWWEVRHLDAPGQLVTRNEIYVPAGKPLLISVTGADVIHSFWFPRLGGKIDAIPGRVNTIRLLADEPGTYHGVCAEFCGTGHAAMTMRMHAHEPDVLGTVLSEALSNQEVGNE